MWQTELNAMAGQALLTSRGGQRHRNQQRAGDHADLTRDVLASSISEKKRACHPGRDGADQERGQSVLGNNQ